MVLTVTKDEQLRAIASGNLAQQGQQVEGDTLGVLAHQTAGVGTARIEVSQVGTVPLLKGLASLLCVLSLAVDEVLNDELDGAFGSAVWVGRADGAVLGDGNHVLESSSISVDGRGGREDDVGDIVPLHGAQEGNGAADIDAVVLERNL